MQKLHREPTAVPLHRARHIGEALELRVVPQAGKAERRINRIFINEVTAKDDHSEPGLGAFFVIGDRLLGEDALVRASDPGRAYRPEYHPVRQGCIANAKRREQVAIGPGIGHGRFPLTSFVRRIKEHAAPEGARALRLPPSTIGFPRVAIRY